MVRNSREDWKTYGNVFDEFTRRLLFKLSGQGFFDELEQLVTLGKEANVFVAKKGDGHVIVKIYRLENCNFNKMYEYIRQDPRYVAMPKSRRKVIFSWVQREYRNLLKAREAIRVPTPMAFKDHVLVMELIGHDSVSPMLKNSHPKDPKAFFDIVLERIIELWKSGLVHGDLSEFNILNHDEEPVFIDFSQATVTDAKEAKNLLLRDVENLCNFFKRLKDARDPKEVYDFILEKATIL